MLFFRPIKRQNNDNLFFKYDLIKIYQQIFMDSSTKLHFTIMIIIIIYKQFHNSIPKSSVHINRILVRNSEMGLYKKIEHKLLIYAHIFKNIWFLSPKYKIYALASKSISSFIHQSLNDHRHLKLTDRAWLKQVYHILVEEIQFLI